MLTTASVFRDESSYHRQHQTFALNWPQLAHWQTYTTPRREQYWRWRGKAGCLDVNGPSPSWEPTTTQTYDAVTVGCIPRKPERLCRNDGNPAAKHARSLRAVPNPARQTKEASQRSWCMRLEDAAALSACWVHSSKPTKLTTCSTSCIYCCAHHTRASAPPWSTHWQEHQQAGAQEQWG